ncbi:MAG: YihY/virulence factor BrkB family protein [Salinisphaera sp.]|jgi:membrane protein|nr:YihY/virulence factor BrkB family protein [Salinisphaera sp.]
MSPADNTRPPKEHDKPRWPAEIGWRDWLSVLGRVGHGVRRHEVSMDAAAISFLALFAIFSAVSAFVAFYGLFSNPGTVVTDMKALQGFVPADVVVSLIGNMQSVSLRPTATLWGAGIFSAFISIWCAQQGIDALMVAFNMAYEQTIDRSGYGHLLHSLALALAVICGLAVAACLAIGLPVFARMAGDSLVVAEVVRAIGMTVAGLLLFFGLAALYRFIPDRRPPRWRWVRFGAGIVVAFWAIASILFSVLLSYSNSYTTMYGSLSAVVLLLTLTYVTVATVLVGVEFNAQIEAHCGDTNG